MTITFVYGHPDQAKKGKVWEQLSALKTIAHSNWLCIGDFNQILSKEEKFSFKQGSILVADWFQQVISDLQLCNFHASGQRFTWMNNREENDLVMERLDRAFANIEWINLYPSYSLRNLPIIRSNHGLILLDFELQTPFRKRPFRFEHMWVSHPACKDMIKQARSPHGHRYQGSRAEQLRRKLLNVQMVVMVWNKTVFWEG